MFQTCFDDIEAKNRQVCRNSLHDGSPLRTPAHQWNAKDRRQACRLLDAADNLRFKSNANVWHIVHERQFIPFYLDGRLRPAFNLQPGS